VLSSTVGAADGATLVVGLVLGAGLRLGAPLGRSVGQGVFFDIGDGVLDWSIRRPMWEIAVAPTSFDTIELRESGEMK
jgi:hypothetical protein